MRHTNEIDTLNHKGDDTMKIYSEDEARQEENCIGCGNHKSNNALVCWDCFKYSPVPLKYFNGTFENWQITREN
jgi:hypothetical protein